MHAKVCDLLPGDRKLMRCFAIFSQEIANSWRNPHVGFTFPDREKPIPRVQRIDAARSTMREHAVLVCLPKPSQLDLICRWYSSRQSRDQRNEIVAQ